MVNNNRGNKTQMGRRSMCFLTLTIKILVHCLEWLLYFIILYSISLLLTQKVHNLFTITPAFYYSTYGLK